MQANYFLETSTLMQIKDSSYQSEVFWRSSNMTIRLHNLQKLTNPLQHQMVGTTIQTKISISMVIYSTVNYTC